MPEPTGVAVAKGRQNAAAERHSGGAAGCGGGAASRALVSRRREGHVALRSKHKGVARVQATSRLATRANWLRDKPCDQWSLDRIRWQQCSTAAVLQPPPPPATSQVAAALPK